MDHIVPTPGYRRLAAGTAVVLVVLISIGGAVRATDSGLACPTWPGCFTAGDFLPPADLNVWLEHTHRLVAGAAGLLIAAMTLWTLMAYRSRRDLLWPVLAAAVLVNVQAGLGAFVVWLQLRADLVTAHLGLAMVVLACVLTVAVRSARVKQRHATAQSTRLVPVSLAVALLAFGQILVGGHVTGIGAGLAYDLEGFPFFAGAVFPAVASEQELFHVAHRLLAYLLAAAVVWLCTEAVRHRRLAQLDGSWSHDQRWLVNLPMWTAALVVLQILIGVANVASGLSWLAVIPHLAVASWIWTLLVLQSLLAVRWRYTPQQVAAPSGNGADGLARKIPA